MIYWDDIWASVGDFFWVTCLVVTGIAALALMVVALGFVFHFGWSLAG